jgi:TonB family protein
LITLRSALFHTRPYPPGGSHGKQIWPFVLLAVLGHIFTLLFFLSDPPSPGPVHHQEINISLEASLSDSIPAARTIPEAKPHQPEALETPLPVQDSPAAEAAPPPVTAPAAAAPPQESQPLSSLTRLPRFSKKIDAIYPATERRAGIQASVLAEIAIDAQGNIQEVRIVKSAGAAFDTAVIEALKKSQFTPGYIDDKAVPVRFQVPFRFNLN